MFRAESFERELAQIRAVNPLVLNITNHVVTNTTANALLAIGASPIMSFAREEADELVALSQALVVNLGTLNERDIEVMEKAWEAADKRPIPVLLDPVGVGASELRTETALHLLNLHRPAVIRGNASEIMTLAGETGEAKGVDSTRPAEAARFGAKALAQVYECVVCVSGEEDIVTDGSRMYRVSGGDPLMPKVTGMGCTATAICGAFAGIGKHPLQATVNGMAAMAIAGSMAVRSAGGPGTFQAHLFDALYAMTPADIEQLYKVEAE